MMEISKVISKAREYVINQVNVLAKTNPLIGFTKPLIVRIIDNNIDKADKTLSLLAGKDGNIDIENIMAEMIESVMNTKPFNIHTSFMGDINIGDGKIILNIPFTDKNIVFNQSDLENLRNTLMADK